MKRIAPVLLALTLLLSACGAAPAVEPTDSPEPEITPTPAPDATPVSTAAVESGRSPLASVIFKELANSRRRCQDDDEQMIRETLWCYFLLRNDVLNEIGYDFPDFSPFFDETSPSYDELVMDVDKARYHRLVAEVYDSRNLDWYNTTVRIDSLEIDGDTARVEAYDQLYFVYEGMNFMSGEGTMNSVELRKIDGVWRMSGLTAADSFHDITHEELLEDIAELEGQL